MRKSLTLGLLLPALALGGCTMFSGSKNVIDPENAVARVNRPLAVPSTFTLPPPGQAAPSAQAR